jgi:hypothetical protein
MIPMPIHLPGRTPHVKALFAVSAAILIRSQRFCLMKCFVEHVPRVAPGFEERPTDARAISRQTHLTPRLLRACSFGQK